MRAKCLIVGGGDCGIAEEVLKHKTVKRLTQVEIDAAVIEFSKEHFPEFTKPVFADKRFESVIDDGMKYVAKTERRFDVIIVDSTDPQGPGKILFSQKFYAALQTLHEPGRRAGDAERRADLSAERARLEHLQVSHLFADGTCYIAAIPTYVGGHMAMGFATDNTRLRQTPVKTHRRTLPQGRQLQDQILDAGSAGGGIRAAAFHCRRGGEGKAAAMNDLAARRGVALRPRLPAKSIVNGASPAAGPMDGPQDRVNWEEMP